ncbi:hypothetical protein BFS07_03610 [Clostridium perfringens]|nr:hypothetical protein [Clostridium perfringens]TBX09810.1 hypothetical protein BFS07_03610 [Clostridium perfringens]HAT4301364.1 hypothetical protein [Clostridium perfringens]
MILDVVIFSIICIPINIFLKNKFYSKYFKRYFLIALFLNFLALFLGLIFHKYLDEFLYFILVNSSYLSVVYRGNLKLNDKYILKHLIKAFVFLLLALLLIFIVAYSFKITIKSIYGYYLILLLYPIQVSYHLYKNIMKLYYLNQKYIRDEYIEV